MTLGIRVHRMMKLKVPKLYGKWRFQVEAKVWIS